jgi:superfamily II DNA or RNA helicase
MIELSPSFIRKHVADSAVIFQRGAHIYRSGSFHCEEADLEHGQFVYDVDGSYGDYKTIIQLEGSNVKTSCDCPYPGSGCKHTVAVLLDVCDRINAGKAVVPPEDAPGGVDEESPCLGPEEIRGQAIEDRKKRARSEDFKVIMGEMFKGEHLVETLNGKTYTVTLHDPSGGCGHCSCPDYLTNRLNTCKHLIFLTAMFKKRNDFKSRILKERFPFIDIFWDSERKLPRMFCERPEEEISEIRSVLDEYFDREGLFTKASLLDFLTLLGRLDGQKRVRFRESVLTRVDDFLHAHQLREMASDDHQDFSFLRTELYPYQREGVRFALYKKGALIGDEMGLGKTLQAIALAVLKKQVFGFSKVLVVTMSSLKEQWKREIERFSGEKAMVVGGSRLVRRQAYQDQDAMFKITNYEAVLRDGNSIGSFSPDLVILDEAQRIKNFNTKTADAIKGLPRKHSIVLTGTPLENRLEDVYSIVQFLDPNLLAPLWQFAADHFLLSRKSKGKILGYRNLEKLHEKLRSIVIRRRKEEVLKDLPEQLVNNYYLDLSEQQAKLHAGFKQSLFPLLNKKFLTPMDIRRIQEILLCMRRVCDSTFLIDRNTHISPKLTELDSILDELVIQNKRKVVIFSEWTTMTYLIGRHLSLAKIPFVELTGRVPVPKRQLLIDEFTKNPDCRVFLSTDAGGTGLNLQAADCVINFELPWNPARLNQRIGRVHRIGQKSKCVNVVNLICKQSVEENILAGIQLKTEVFKGVFDGEIDTVLFSREKRTEMLNEIRKLMGEEPEAVAPEMKSSEEIPADTPHYLNPKVLQEAETVMAYDQEESVQETPELESEPRSEAGQPAGAFLAEQSPERLETVLNSGMQFIGGLLEMATGKKIEVAAGDQKMISIDRNSGEVTLRFKLPGF